MNSFFGTNLTLLTTFLLVLHVKLIQSRITGDLNKHISQLDLSKSRWN